MKLCDKIAKLRKINGLSQENLADKLGVSRQSVFKWESGENTPDLEKIKKLAKLFNVSFDLLLDDEKDVDSTNEVIESQNNTNVIVKKTIKYRKSYDSWVKLNSSDLADLEHGYVEEKKIEGYSFEKYSEYHNKLVALKEYTKVIRVQNDVLVDFFVDDKKKIFGFFFDGAPQFVCPYENFSAISISNAGISTGYTQSPILGVGIGKSPSVTVGSMPLAQTRLPLRYDCTISYFNVNGELKNYNISFNCVRTYVAYDGTCNKIDDLYLWENILSQNTNKSLNEISAYLSGIKDVGNQIRNGIIEVSELEISPIISEVKAGQEKKKEIKNAFETVKEKQAKRTKIIQIIFVSAIVLFLIVVGIISLIKLL